jgi:hypothetical protein
MKHDSKLIFEIYKNSFLFNESDEEWKSELIDISVFDPNESEKYRKKRPGLYGRENPEYNWKEKYKENTAWGTWGFWVWNAIQVVDITQVTSVPDLYIAVDDFKTEPNKTNAAVLSLEIFFFVVGFLGLEILKLSYRIAKQTPEAMMNFFAKEVLPRKQLIFDTLQKVPKGTAIIPIAQQAFSVLETPENINNK